MSKIVIIGAGSGFGAKLSRDILSLPDLQDSHIVLVDTHAGRLNATTRFIQRFVMKHQLPATIEGTVERRKALPGADFVVTSISVGGDAYAGHPVTAEVNIPKKYGIQQSVADTIGVGGIFRFLRTGPVQWAICQDMEELCPKALLLNYTNPMCMLTWTHSAGTHIQNVGLCHSVQGTARQIAGYIGIPADELRYRCAGINHQAWYLTLEHRGQDVYPLLRAKLEDPETVAKDNIRFEMYRHFGYFVTESSRHCSEYHPYFRRTPDLMQHYGLTEWVVAETRNDSKRSWLTDPEGVDVPDLSVSEEYAAKIVQAVVTDVPYRFNGNVMNHGLITNLPEGCCVEVPCLVDGQGVQATHIGVLPPQLAHLNLTNIAVQELAVRAVLDRDKDAAYHACLLDPLARSVCTLDQMRHLFDELWEAEGDLLAHFA